eukprot:scaffold36087_cov62-Isochrysis_galbana.AAC.1
MIEANNGDGDATLQVRAHARQAAEEAPGAPGRPGAFDSRDGAIRGGLLPSPPPRCLTPTRARTPAHTPKAFTEWLWSGNGFSKS